MSSPWSSSADPNSIWNSNSPNLNILRRYSLRSSSTAATNQSPSSILLNTAPSNSSSSASSKSTCSWEPSMDGKYLIGYIVINQQDLGGIDNSGASLGFNICGGKPTYDGQYGAIVEHVVPGSPMNLICKLKVDDEIVEWNGFNLRNKRDDEVCDIIESVKNANSLRLVAIRMLNNNNAASGVGGGGGAAAAAAAAAAAGNNNKITDVTS